MLRFIALTILAYFIFRSLDRFFGGAPAAKKRNGSAKNRRSASKSKVNKNVGEYIDYEEVKDDK